MRCATSLDAAATAGTAGAGDETADPLAYRLPATVRPRRYELELVPDLAGARFGGNVVVEIEVTEEVAEIVCNAAELEITSAVLADSPERARSGDGAGDDAGALRATVALDEEAERATFAFSETIPPGTWFLALEFRGILNDKLHGFYRSVYTDAGGDEHVIATTHCEATDARRAFPCWDEPDAKAVFAITLVVDDGLLAVSNWPVASDEPAGPDTPGKRRIRFGDTIPMSTYLVAFVVGPLDVTQPVDVDGVPLRIVHVPGKAHMTPFALEIGAHSLRFFSGYFGIPYPGAKLDLIALPDFAFGAMENLGAVTFRETALLADVQNAARTDLERVADVVAHEIAHMWFGDLVTMRWWNGIWLNEAFATFMELLCVDAFRPEWERWVTFGLSREAAMGVDGLASTRAIEFPVHAPSEAEGMFDVLTYQKGAAVLRMLEQYLGPEVFRDGIRDYLVAHSYANTETSDLWDALEAAAAKPAATAAKPGDAATPGDTSAKGDAATVPVRTMMDTWIFQGGYPLVGASLEAAETGAPARLVLTQSPFRYSPEAEPGAIGSSWLVPVLAAVHTEEEATPPDPLRRLLDASEGSVDLDVPGGPAAIVGAAPDAIGGSGQGIATGSATPAAHDGGAAGRTGTAWLSANSGGWGFYRVRYDDTLSSALRRRLAVRPPLERFNLVADTWACALVGIDDVTAFCDLAAALAESNESDVNVWSIVVGALGLFDRVMHEDDRPLLQRATRNLLGGTLDRVGWEHAGGEHENVRTLRALVIEALGVLGKDEPVRREAIERHDAALRNETPLDADIAGAVLDIAADDGGADRYERILAGYRDPATPQDEQRHLLALAGFRELELVERTLAASITEVRTQNAPFLLRQLLANRQSQGAAWAFIERNWDELVERFPSNTIPHMLDGVRALCAIAPDGSTPLADRARAFLAEHPLRSGRRTVDQTLERLSVNLAFAHSARDRLTGALEAIA